MAQVMSEYGSIEAMYAGEVTSAEDDPTNSLCAYRYFLKQYQKPDPNNRVFHSYLRGWNDYVDDWRKSVVQSY